MWFAILFLSLFAQARAQTHFNDLPHIYYSRNPYYASEGFRLGFILDFHRQNILLWSYEGQLMTGFGADRGAAVDQNCLDQQMTWIDSIKIENKKEQAIETAKTDCFVLDNPFLFSTLNSNMYKQYLEIKDLQITPVLLYYVTPFFAFSHAITHTTNYVEGIYPINPDEPIPDNFKLSTFDIPISKFLNEERGVVPGRVVAASLDHYLRKSFEVIIQQGPLGNNFRRMSVSSQEMFDFLVKAMLTGKMLRLGYVEIVGAERPFIQIGKDYDTPFRIVSVEVEKETPSFIPPGVKR